MTDRKVRTTLHPHTTITVDEAEFTDLQRQGLLLEDDRPAPADNRTPAATGDRK
jgi:hypothetical protein